jgi:hypothetical protein
MDTADKDKKVATPTLDSVGRARTGASNEFIDVWRKYGTNMQAKACNPATTCRKKCLISFTTDFTKFFTYHGG